MGLDFSKAVGWTRARLSGELASRYIGSSLPLGAMIGDSITKPDYTNSDQVTPTSASSWNKSSNAIMAWALALSGQRVEMPPNTNVWSFPGQTSATILANLPAFLAQLPRVPGFVVVECGTNDSATNIPAATTIANWTAIANYLTSRGVRVIFIPILPRNSTNFTQARADQAVLANRWLIQAAARSGGQIAVAAACLRDWALTTSTLFEPVSGLTYDSPATHPNTLGAYYIGKAVAAILMQWYPPVDLLPMTALAWDATNSPNANYLADCMYTSGAAANGPTTGTKPINWTSGMSAHSGLTAACSLAASSIDGMPMAQIVFGGTYTVSGISVPSSATDPYARFQRTISAGDARLTAIAAGDTFECLAAFEIDAGNNAIICPQLEWRWDGSSNQCSDMRHAADAQGTLPANEAIKGVLRTPPHTFSAAPAGTMQVNLTAFLKGTTGTYSPAATIRFGRPVIRKVT